MSRFPVPCVVVLAAAFACQPAAETTPAPDTAADEAAIHDLVASFDEAVRAEDIAAMMTRYHTDAVRMQPNTPAAVGAAAIRQLFVNGWAADDFDVTNVLEDLRIQGDLATGRGTFSTRVTPADGSPAYDNSGNWAAVWQRQADGSWMTIWDIWNSELPPRPPAQ